MLGELGQRALAEHASKLPLSRALRQLREWLDIAEEIMAHVLGTSIAGLEELESGALQLTREQAEALLSMLREARELRCPELEFAFARPLEQLSEREGNSTKDSIM